MPVEIRELVIRATVGEESEAATRNEGRPAPPGSASSERTRLIAECVDQVMEVLREQKER